MSLCSYRPSKDADPCIFYVDCDQYGSAKWYCNYASGPGTCKLWRLKKAEGKK
jgi:hypothetical protein